MAFIFPEDKNDFRAPNGVVYRWDGFKWVVKSFRSHDDFLVTLDDDPPDEPKEGDLWFDTKADELTLYLYTGTEWVPAAPPVSLDGIQAQIDSALITQDDLLGRVAAGETKQRQIELALEELSVAKGTVARYTVTETHIGAAIRNGELYVSSPNAADVQAISFAPFDLNGQPTRPANTGDIIEFVQVARDVGGVTRYRIVDGGDSQALVVEYISGNNNFAKGESEEVYIYPQNDETASKEYVDAQDALLQEQIDDRVKKSGIQVLDKTKWRLQQPDAGNTNRNFIEIDNSNMKLFHVQDPTDGSDAWAANKGYVDSKVATSVEGLATEQYVDEAVAAIPAPTGGVPVGSIMIWMNSSAPAGWFKLQGGSFDVNQYPQLHAYLQNTAGYSSGRLPSWGGHYPGEYGDHLNQSLGSKQGYKTGKPQAGAPRSSASIPNGNTRGFNGAGGTNAYSDGKGKVSIDENWDTVTRPKTVVVHYIIKHD